MPDLKEGESTTMQGSARAPYTLKNVGGVYSCSCPAWRNQSLPIERRTCKHLRKLRGDEAEQERVGSALPAAKPETKAIAPKLLLAHNWQPDEDPADWWMSEKLDGVRAFWDGAKFISRQGNEYHAPDWFTAELPKIALDGELWLNRKAFQQTVSIVRCHDKPDSWRSLKYVVFDIPDSGGPFEERLALLKDTIPQQALPYVWVLDQVRCQNQQHLQQQLDRISALGGEGIMLRQPGSPYETGRSHTLLKVKQFHDAEATVVDHTSGKGRHKGRLGALVVELPDGTTFSVGSGLTDAQRDDPPAIGSVITFRYQELTDGGVPRFPTFVRVASQ